MSERIINITYAKYHGGKGNRYGIKIKEFDGWLNCFGTSCFPKGLITDWEAGPPKGEYKAEIEREEYQGKTQLKLKKASPLFSWGEKDEPEQDDLFAKPEATGRKSGTTAEFKHKVLLHYADLWISSAVLLAKQYNLVPELLLADAEKYAVSEWIEACRSGVFPDLEHTEEELSDDWEEDIPPITDEDIPFSLLIGLVLLGYFLVPSAMTVL